MILRFAAFLLLCLFVGLLLDSLGISARGILHHGGSTILLVGRLFGEGIRWSVPYVLLGAVVVLPAALLIWILRRGRRR